MEIMPIKYKFMRVPSPIFNRLKEIQGEMQRDVSFVYGKPLKLTMPKVLRAITDPKLNRNFIEVNMKDLVVLAKEKQKK
jgi:hypothetical protein